jgi:hypothetical protein
MANILDEMNKPIRKMNVTRWNSEYMLIKSILFIGKNDLHVITSALGNSVKFSNTDLLVLDEVVNILEPFYEISVKCQTNSAVTASLVVPSIVYLIAYLHDIKDDVLHSGKLIQQLQESIETRFSGIIRRLNQSDAIDNDHFSDPLYFITAVLDPMFKVFWIKYLKLSARMENHLKQNINQMLIDELKKDMMPCSKSTRMNYFSTTLSCSNSSPKKNVESYFSMMIAI